MSISEARARLTELARHVVASPGAVVVIDNQRMDEPVVLTSERHLRYLEAKVAELQKRDVTGFRLCGSVETELTADRLAAALAEMRAEAESSFADRLSELAG